MTSACTAPQSASKICLTVNNEVAARLYLEYAALYVLHDTQKVAGLQSTNGYNAQRYDANVSNFGVIFSSSARSLQVVIQSEPGLDTTQCRAFVFNY